MASVTRSISMAAIVAIGQASASAALFVALASALSNNLDGIYVSVITIALCALAFSQALLLASWLTLGPGSWPARIGTTLVFASATALLYGFGIALSMSPGAWLKAHEIIDSVLCVAVVPLLIAAPFGAIARSWNWRWLGETTPPGKPPQFSLRLALWGTVVAAVVITGARQLHEHADELVQLPPSLPRTSFVDQVVFLTYGQLVFATRYASLFASAGVGMAACFGPRISLTAVAVALSASLCFGLLNAYSLAAVDAVSLALWSGFATASCVWMILNMLVLRAGGMRIDRAPRASEPRQPTLDALAPEPAIEPAS